MATASIRVEQLPEFAELFRATHVLLVRRLKGQLDTPDGLRAWNDLIDAHDAIATATALQQREEPDGGGPAEGEVLDNCCAAEHPAQDHDGTVRPSEAPDDGESPTPHNAAGESDG